MSDTFELGINTQHSTNDIKNVAVKEKLRKLRSRDLKIVLDVLKASIK